MKSLFITLVFIGSEALASVSLVPRTQLKQKTDPRLFRTLDGAHDVIDEFKDKHTVLVRLKGKADLSQMPVMNQKGSKTQWVYERLRRAAQKGQKEFIQFLDTEKLRYRPFLIANMVQVFGAKSRQIEAIASRADVTMIYGDYKRLLSIPHLFGSEEYSIFRFSSQEGPVGPNISHVKADLAWEKYGAKGQGIVVGHQDTGIDWKHQALQHSYRGYSASGTNHNYNWMDGVSEPIGENQSTCGYSIDEPCDDNGHGTHTLGTILGSEGSENQIGMAPEAKWMGCRNMDAGVGRPSSYLSCFEFFLAPYPEGGSPFADGRPELSADVINNSWECLESETCLGDILEEVLLSLKAAGIFVVSAAGNSGPNCSTIKTTPAWHTGASFVVGAIDHRSGQVASFSSRGPSTFDGGIGPQVVAPGVRIRSSTKGGGYSGMFWSGTSMAAPHVTGLVAQMWSVNSKLVGNIDATSDILISSSRSILEGQCMPGGVQQTPNNTYGYGEINAIKAVELALKFN